MINIRNAEITDAERLVEIYGYYVKNTAITFEYDIPSLTEFRQRMEQTMRRYPYIVIEQDGVIQGYAYAGAFVGRADRKSTRLNSSHRSQSRMPSSA